jgi:hypothetical protein
MRSGWVGLLAALAAAWALALERSGKAQAAEPLRLVVGDAELTLEVPELERLEHDGRTDETLKGWWHGTVAGSEIEILLRVLDRETYWLADPEDVTEYTESVCRDPEYGGDKLFAYAHRETVSGPFGFYPYAAFAHGPRPNQHEPKGEVIVLGGVLEKHAYVVRVTATPVLPKEPRDQIVAFLKSGVKATGKVQDKRWTDAEAKERWAKSTPDPKVREGLKDVVRTEHYIILTNSGAGALFAKKMESYYDYIQKIFPFEEHPHRRLMPVLLFKSKEEYYAFASHTGAMKDADTTKGHAWKDYYATYYDSPNDPVHIHEATHQIFMNRLRLPGGGSWFQEGVAEYICTKPGMRKAFAKQAAGSGEHPTFRGLMMSERLLAGVEPIDGYAAYTMAASIIELLREDKRFAPKFQEVVHALGGLAREDLEGTQAVFRKAYDLDIDGLEAAWKKYWQAR